MRNPYRTWFIAVVLWVTTLPEVIHADTPAPSPNAYQLAAKIDQLIAARCESEGVQPAAIADDAEFLRRVYLDLAGRIPVTKDVREFLEDQSPDKRQRLVEHLLESGLYVNHFTNVWRSLLLPQTNNPEVQILVPGFEAWLRQRIGKNQRFNELVQEILTASTTAPRPNRRMGNAREPTPAAFYQANELKPENLAAATSRLFLGIKLECAQCHNHPHASWTRQQFWEFAAFFAGVQPVGQAEPLPSAQDIPEGRAIRIPGTPPRIALARFLDDTEPNWKPGMSARSALVDWLTATDNPYFARAAVNRLWAHLFGTGLIDPVDDLSRENPPSHPELLDELARQFVASGYDAKFILRAIAFSQTYQRSSAASHPSQDDPRLFAHMAVKGLTPEQLFDSLAQAIGYYDEAAPMTRFEGLGANTPRAMFVAKFTSQDKRTEHQTSILQALALMNGKLTSEATSIERSKTLAAVLDSPFLDTPQRIETLYMASLSRKPRPEEAARVLKYVTSGGPKRDPGAALSDVFWALLNSAEFMLNH
jgi:hypothetical protein